MQPRPQSSEIDGLGEEPGELLGEPLGDDDDVATLGVELGPALGEELGRALGVVLGEGLGLAPGAALG